MINAVTNISSFKSDRFNTRVWTEGGNGGGIIHVVGDRLVSGAALVAGAAGVGERFNVKRAASAESPNDS